MAYQSVNAYDGKILKTFEELSDNQVAAVSSAVSSCFEVQVVQGLEGIVNNGSHPNAA